MTRRSLVSVLIWSFLTAGIYALYWAVKTKDELNANGARIPTAWLLLLGPVAFYWAWKYCEGVEQVSRGKLSAVIGFLLVLVGGPLAIVVFQSTFNQIAATQGVSRVA